MNLFSQRHGRDAVGLCTGASFFLKRLALVIYTHTHETGSPFIFCVVPQLIFFYCMIRKCEKKLFAAEFEINFITILMFFCVKNKVLHI
jgi:hypothetical protein